MDFRPDRAGARRNQACGPTLWPRHLSEPARDHHRRANDGCLHLGRDAGVIQPLVVRQAFPEHREKLPPWADGAGVRNRHQFQSLYCLPDGREQPDDAGAGDRARGVRPQLLLQGQLPVPKLDRCRRHRRLYGVRQELHRRMRAAAWHRCGGRIARFMPRAAEPWRGPLQAPGQAVGGARGGAHQRARRLCAVASERHLAHIAAARRAGTQRRARALSARARRKPAVLH